MPAYRTSRRQRPKAIGSCINNFRKRFVRYLINRQRPHLTEWGVVFGKARTDGRGGQRSVVTWFKSYELRILGAAAASESHRRGVTVVMHPGNAEPPTSTPLRESAMPIQGVGS